MKLKDILPDHYINIQARTNGDSYSIEEEIIKYEFDEYGLAYWFESKWI